ncbi:MAG: hypothetical protein Q6K99_01285 [Thermostichales cyanobacterium BF4_bins_65]
MSDSRVPPRRQPPPLPPRTSRTGEEPSSRRYSQERYDRYSSPRPSSYGDPPPPPRSSSGTSSGSGAVSSLTVLTVVALVAFFTGFAARNFLADRGYDDERVVKAQNVPEVFRRFCVDYNGYPSFTVVQLTSVSALTMASVPILRLDTCTIPVSQTANALQALGINRRDASIGPQLGGSNLTLINASVGRSMAQALVSRFPNLVSGGDPERVINQVEETLTSVLTSGMDGLGLQNLQRTNIPNVYVMVPGHSFNLQPQLNNE